MKKKIMHLYCTDHVLHLTCKRCYERESFGDSNEISPIQKATNVVSHFQSSTQATEQLKKVQTIHDTYKGKVAVVLLTDCVTRWWSTFQMIDRVIYLKNVLNILEYQIPAPKRLNDRDWVELNSVHSVLEPFCQVQLWLKGEKYVSSSYVVPSVVACRRSLVNGHSTSELELIRKLSETMAKDFDSRWGSGNSPIYSGQVICGYRQR